MRLTSSRDAVRGRQPVGFFIGVRSLPVKQSYRIVYASQAEEEVKFLQKVGELNGLPRARAMVGE